MTLERLLNLYEEGTITSHHFIVEALILVDLVGSDAVLPFLPEELYSELTTFVDSYKPNQMITNYGKIPSWESVQAVKMWFQNKQVFGTKS